MNWLQSLYEVFGANSPRLSIAVAVAVGGIVFGGGWWLVGRQYAKDHPVPPSQIASSSGQPVHIEQVGPINSPNVIGNNNQVTIGGGPPAERSFCPDRGLVQSAEWNSAKLGCTDITIPWDAPGWENVQAVADFTVLVNATPGTSQLAHLRIVEVSTGATVSEQVVREIRPTPTRIEPQTVKLVVPRTKGTHSYRLEFRTEEKAAISVKGPILFT